MILSAQSIRKAGIFTPFNNRTIHECGMSYGLSSAGSDIYWNDVPNERRLYLDGAELPFDMGDLRKAALSLGMEKGE